MGMRSCWPSCAALRPSDCSRLHIASGHGHIRQRARATAASMTLAGTWIVCAACLDADIRRLVEDGMLHA